MLHPRHRWQKALGTLPFASSFLYSFSHILNICPESAAQTEGFPAHRVRLWENPVSKMTPSLTLLSLLSLFLDLLQLLHQLRGRDNMTHCSALHDEHKSGRWREWGKKIHGSKWHVQRAWGRKEEVMGPARLEYSKERGPLQETKAQSLDWGLWGFFLTTTHN